MVCVCVCIGSSAGWCNRIVCKDTIENDISFSVENCAKLVEKGCEGWCHTFYVTEESEQWITPNVIRVDILLKSYLTAREIQKSSER